MNDADLRREAMEILQIADVSSVLSCVEQLVKELRPTHPHLTDPIVQFLQNRKAIAQQLLLHIEQSDPTRAAALQKLLDEYSRITPLDYR